MAAPVLAVPEGADAVVTKMVPATTTTYVGMGLGLVYSAGSTYLNTVSSTITTATAGAACTVSVAKAGAKVAADATIVATCVGIIGTTLVASAVAHGAKVLAARACSGFLGCTSAANEDAYDTFISTDAMSTSEEDSTLAASSCAAPAAGSGGYLYLCLPLGGASWAFTIGGWGLVQGVVDGAGTLTTSITRAAAAVLPSFIRRYIDAKFRHARCAFLDWRCFWRARVDELRTATAQVLVVALREVSALAGAATASLDKYRRLTEQMCEAERAQAAAEAQLRLYRMAFFKLAGGGPTWLLVHFKQLLEHCNMEANVPLLMAAAATAAERAVPSKDQAVQTFARVRAYPAPPSNAAASGAAIADNNPIDTINNSSRSSSGAASSSSGAASSSSGAASSSSTNTAASSTIASSSTSPSTPKAIDSSSGGGNIDTPERHAEQIDNPATKTDAAIIKKGWGSDTATDSADLIAAVL